MRNPADNYFLIGLMGAGKSTVGRALARRTAKNFYDSDQEIGARAGVRISTIFDIEGELCFRDREAAVIADLVRLDNIVLATGGGAVIRPQNRACLSTHGTVIYLRSTIEHLLSRTLYDKSRPLLQSSDPRAKLESLLHERDPLYCEVADIIVDTTQRNINLLVNHLIEQLACLPPKNRPVQRS